MAGFGKLRGRAQAQYPDPWGSRGPGKRPGGVSWVRGQALGAGCRWPEEVLGERELLSGSSTPSQDPLGSSTQNRFLAKSSGGRALSPVAR